MPSFFCFWGALPIKCLIPTFYLHITFLSETPAKPDNRGMEQIFELLRSMGFTDAECLEMAESFRNNPESFAEYVLIMRLHYDDRREYMA